MICASSRQVARPAGFAAPLPPPRRARSLLGVLLATIGAYVALAAGYLTDIVTLSHVPVLHLLVIAAGVPLVAFAAGWLLAGREPHALARQPIH